MALIGTMKYLTIGDQTYEIAGDELQIASASTLGGIKVGSGLSINSTTGVLSASITESDPVFSASAAAGITSTDISNWNAKVSKSGDTMSGNLILDLNNKLPSQLQLNYNASKYITLKDNGVEGNVGYLLLGNQTNTGASTGNVRIRGVANPVLTYDVANKKYVDDSIPTVYSSTNTGGYLTMATLPIYDGGVS